MSYFQVRNSLGAIISRPQAETTALLPGTKVATETSISFEQMKAAWSRCSFQVRDNRTGTVTTRTGGYLYNFADGKSLCSPSWNQEAYSMVVKGESPGIAVPDLSKVRPGSAEYFRWLCRAQGEASDPSVQAVRTGFDRANLRWMPTERSVRGASIIEGVPGESRMEKWTGYSSAPHPKIRPENISPCALYANFGTNIREWEWRAYEFSLNQEGKEGVRPGGASATQEHRAGACLASGLPAQYIPCCEQALARGGYGIETYLAALEKQDPAVMECFQTVQQAAESKKKSNLIMIAGAVGVVVVGAALLKKGKR